MRGIKFKTFWLLPLAALPLHCDQTLAQQTPKTQSRFQVLTLSHGHSDTEQDLHLFLKRISVRLRQAWQQAMPLPTTKLPPHLYQPEQALIHPDFWSHKPKTKKKRNNLAKVSLFSFCRTLVQELNNEGLKADVTSKFKYSTISITVPLRQPDDTLDTINTVKRIFSRVQQEHDPANNLGLAIPSVTIVLLDLRIIKFGVYFK